MLLARSGSEISALAGEIGNRALALTCDVSDPDDVQTAVAQAVSTFGMVDILISNAGVIDPISPISGSDLQGWGRAIDINVKGVYYGVHAVLPHMIAQGGGSIFTIGSGAAHSPLEGWSHYCTSKAAVYMFNQCVDREYRGKGIRRSACRRERWPPKCRSRSRPAVSTPSASWTRQCTFPPTACALSVVDVRA